MTRSSKIEKYAQQMKELISQLVPDAEFRGPYRNRNLDDEGIWYLEVRSNVIQSSYDVLDLVRHISASAASDNVPISILIDTKTEPRTNAYQLI